MQIKNRIKIDFLLNFFISLLMKIVFLYIIIQLFLWIWIYWFNSYAEFDEFELQYSYLKSVLQVEDFFSYLHIVCYIDILVPFFHYMLIFYLCIFIFVNFFCIFDFIKIKHEIHIYVFKQTVIRIYNLYIFKIFKLERALDKDKYKVTDRLGRLGGVRMMQIKRRFKIIKQRYPSKFRSKFIYDTFMLYIKDKLSLIKELNRENMIDFFIDYYEPIDLTLNKQNKAYLQ